jgi:hypothetical protein
MNTPCNRPRISSGAATCRIVDRKAALTMSNAPDNARKNTPIHNEPARPNAATLPP